jgi:hypothetical protein
MKATRFEFEYQTLLHLLVVGLSLLTYLASRDDIVWALVRNHPDTASWERAVFGAGALMLVAAAALETWARNALRLARILLIPAVGLLLPLSGVIIQIVCETVLLFRLFLRDREDLPAPYLLAPGAANPWGSAFRAAASKWALAATMILFAWTLRDRIAEIGAAISVAVWLALNVPPRLRSRDSKCLN